MYRTDFTDALDIVLVECRADDRGPMADLRVFSVRHVATVAEELARFRRFANHFVELVEAER